MKKENFGKKWLYWFTFAVAVIIVYKTLDNFTEITSWVGDLISLLMPFVFGILLAYLFYIPCRSIEKIYKKSGSKFLTKKARVFSVITAYLMAFLILFIIANFIWPSISKSIVDLTNNLPTYYKNVVNYIESQPDDSILNQINAKAIVADIEQIDIKQFFSFENIIGYIKSAIGFVNAIFTVFVSIIVSIYILLERKEILEFLRKLSEAIFSSSVCANVSKYFNKTNEIFFKFISSQVFDGFVVGVILSIAMLIMGVKYAVLLGFMIGLFNLIPYVGAIIGVAIALIITILTGGISQAIWVGIVIIILQQIDANIINPKIIGNSLKLSPILTIFAITVGGAYFGILGMFLAVPVISVIKILVTDYIDYKRELKNIE